MTVRHVPAQFRTIQAAVEESGPGDTIRVAGGIYAGPVTIGPGRDRLAIIGSGAENVIIEGPGDGAGLTITGSTMVTVTGLTVAGFVTGMEVGTSDNTIRDVTVTGSGVDGIVVSQGAARNLFLRVTVRGSGGDGIQIFGANNYVIDSQFHDNGDDGIDFDGPFNLALHNRASGNDSGLILQGANCLALDNQFVGNVEGIVIRSAGNLIFDNFISRNSRVGILFLDATESLVLANEVSCNLGPGMQALAASGIAVIGNTVENNGTDGIELTGGATAFVIDDSEIEENAMAGIRLLSDTARHIIRRNKLKRNNPDIAAQPPAGENSLFDENECDTSEPRGLCRCDD